MHWISGTYEYPTTTTTNRKISHPKNKITKKQQADYFEQIGDLVKGTALNGLRYEPMFPYFAERAASGAFKVRFVLVLVGYG